jgi:uncharacterized membrane protein
MDLKIIFKRLIILDFILLIPSYLAVTYPSEIVSNFNDSVEPSVNWVTYGIIAIIYLVIYFVNLYLLYKFKNVGKPIFLFLFIFSIILASFLGISASDPFLYIVDGLCWASSGAILVFLYFTPIKKEFEK